MATSDDDYNNNKQTAFNLCQKSFGKGERCGWLFRVWVGIFFLNLPKEFFISKIFLDENSSLLFLLLSSLHNTDTKKEGEQKRT